MGSRKFSVLIFFAWVALAHVQAQSVPSNGFEEWDDRERVELDDYVIAGLVDRTGDATAGSYAIRLENKRVENGSDLSGIVTNAILDDKSYSGGEPYDEAPLSMRFYAKYELAVGDKAEVISIFLLNGAVLGIANIELEGRSDTFTRFSVPINWQISAIPDTVVLIISSRDLETDTVAGDGYLIIDDLHYATISRRDRALRNGDFERWTSNERKVPKGWFTVDDVIETSGNLGIAPLVTQSTEKHGGSYSLKLQNRREFGQLFPGVAATGNDPNDFERPAFPVTRNWKYLEAWYRYNPEGGDSMAIIVGMFRQGIPIGLTLFKSAKVNSEWTYLSVPLSYFTNLVTADSAVLMVGSSNPDAPRGEGSTLFIDDMRFSDSPVGLTEEQFNRIQVYPNPAKELVILKGLENDRVVPYAIYDLQGRFVAKGFSNPQHEIALPPQIGAGIYQLHLFGHQGAISKKLIVE
ncbi:MAG: T9SS type A sorting domain-containing protein [Flavobacteriales bacterium]|nr:T9SS type A sorting domain-containing protein [Flavobacteriales bacterium]